MNQHLLLNAPSAARAPGMDAADRAVFLQETIDLFTRKRQGHLIHRMYVSPQALSFWSEFMKHEGYYVTRSELSLIKEHAGDIDALAWHPAGVIGIENGPGTESAMLSKSAVLFSAISGLKVYLARDWSAAVTRQATSVLGTALPNVPIKPLVCNFLKEPLPQSLGEGRRLMVEFGLTRGNMEGFATDPFPAHVLKSDLLFHRSQLRRGDLYVVTFDANQDKESVEYAYTSPWLTQWGRQLFRMMKDELPVSGNFDPESFDFTPAWHAASHVNANTMVASIDMKFRIGRTPIAIAKGEAFAITNSFKTPAGLFNSIAAAAGFEIAALYQDAQGRMTIPVLRAS